MDIEDDIVLRDFDVNDLENDHDWVKKYIDYAETATSVTSLGSSVSKNLAKAGTRTISYELTQLSALTINGCSAVVKLYDANTTTQ